MTLAAVVGFYVPRFVHHPGDEADFDRDFPPRTGSLIGGSDPALGGRAVAHVARLNQSITGLLPPA